jgi:hypothetical protein
MAQGPNSVAGAMTAISGELRGRIVSGMRCTLWLSYMLYGFTVPHSQVRLRMFIAGILMYETMDSAWFRGKLRERVKSLRSVNFSRIWHLFISTTRARSCLAFCLNLRPEKSFSLVLVRFKGCTK